MYHSPTPHCTSPICLDCCKPGGRGLPLGTQKFVGTQPGPYHVWGLEQGDMKTPALASPLIRVGSTPASTGARRSLVGIPGTHRLALPIPPQTPRTSSKIHPQRREALGVGWDLIGVLGIQDVLLKELVSWEWVVSTWLGGPLGGRKWGWGPEAGSLRQCQVLQRVRAALPRCPMGREPPAPLKGWLSSYPCLGLPWSPPQHRDRK